MAVNIDLLERYIKWKRLQLPLLDLPGDVLAHVCSFLEPRDVIALSNAIGGKNLSHFCASDLMCVPREMQSRWIQSKVNDHVHAFLHSMQDECFYIATSCSFVALFIDWSPFSSATPPQPAAVFEWRADTRPHGCVRLDNGVIQASISESMRRCRPIGHVAAYACFAWGFGKVHVSNVPSVTAYVDLVPSMYSSYKAPFTLLPKAPPRRKCAAVAAKKKIALARRSYRRHRRSHRSEHLSENGIAYGWDGK